MGLLGSAQTTDPGQRMAKTYSELQTWKRQLVKADAQLRNFETATQQLGSMLDMTLHTFPRVWRHTTLGQNDAHLPPDSASLPMPGTAPKVLPSAEATKGMAARLQEQTHQPLDAWHKRYGELKAAMVPLEGSRKHYEASCSDLMKAQANQKKVGAKKGPEAAAALDGAIAEKEALRQERWGLYLELEEATYERAARLAADARQAQGFFASAMVALSAAFAALAQQCAGNHGAAGPSGEGGDHLSSSHTSFSSAMSATPPTSLQGPGRSPPTKQQAPRRQQPQAAPVAAGPAIAATGQPPTRPSSPPSPQPAQQQYYAAAPQPSTPAGRLHRREGSAAGLSPAAAGAVALSQDDLPLGANMPRADSAPSPDGPATSGYIRPAKLPARLPARASSHKGASGPDLLRGPAGGHSRRDSETSEASVLEAQSPASEDASPEMEGPRRYMPSFLRNTSGPNIV